MHSFDSRSPTGDARHHRIDIGRSGGFELTVVDNFRHQPNSQRAIGMDEAAGEDQFRGDGDTDETRQEIA